MLLSPFPGTYWWPEINHQTTFPAVCCCRSAGPFEENSRYRQPKPCFIRKMKESLMVQVEAWETCCVWGEIVLWEACVAGKATPWAVLLSEDGLHSASSSCACKGTSFFFCNSWSEKGFNFFRWMTCGLKSAWVWNGCGLICDGL